MWIRRYLTHQIARQQARLHVQHPPHRHGDIERRLAFQTYIQKFVDHGISSTINLPAWGSELNNEDKIKPIGKLLMKYLPYLRGITFYPDGGRSGQPLIPISYQTAMKHDGEIFYEQGDVCDLKGGGSCGA